VRSFLFWVFSFAAAASALLCITRRSPVASALWLVSTLFQLAALYVLLDAHFLAAVQVLVYAGAIMVLFLFVIMLLNLGRVVEATDIKGPWGKAIAAGAGLLMIAELVALRAAAPPEELRLPSGAIEQAVRQEGAVQAVAVPLFQAYLVPFEITSVLLLAAIVGAVVLAKRKL
jgi:NADH-quinone oxidoreductase subunit J